MDSLVVTVFLRLRYNSAKYIDLITWRCKIRPLWQPCNLQVFEEMCQIVRCLSKIYLKRIRSS